MRDKYHTLTAVDDIAFAALKLSLVEPERTVVIERLREDWMSDVGVIGVLRQEHLLTRSAESPARVYWASRREPMSPRIESLLASFLLDMASAIVYDVLKEFAADNYNILKFLEDRGVTGAALTVFVGDIGVFVEHVRLFMRLHRLKRDVARADEICSVVQAVLSHREFEVDDSADTAVDLLMANLVPAIRGILKTELKEHGVHIADTADGILSEGLAVSPGFGFGVPMRWHGGHAAHEISGYVLLLDERDVHGGVDSRPHMEEAEAVVFWDGSMTSHVAVICRGIHRAAVMVPMPEAEMLARKSFLAVDGSNGKIRGYHNRPTEIIYSGTRRTGD